MTKVRRRQREIFTLMNGLWLDDVRPAPEGWTWVKTLAEAKQAVLGHGGVIEECSLDHDLGATEEMIAEHGLAARGQGEETGLDFVKWLIEEGRVPRNVTIHSWSYDGARNMAKALIDYANAEPDTEFAALTVEPYSPALVARLDRR